VADSGKRPTRRRKTRPGEGPPLQGDGADTMKAGYAKSEVKNQRVRENLEPLEKGERPTVVTVGAVFATVVATIFWVSSFVALLTNTKVNGVEPNIGQLLSTAIVMSLLAWGMWTARYWAVLGFQMLLVLLILAAIAGLVVAGTLIQMVSTTILLIGLSLLFYFMVKAMARIQMPQSPSQR
jgi:hypothetical protein